MGRYIQDSEVEVRLLGKVRFTDDDNDENKFSRKLLKKLVRDAESIAERDLSPRYAVPFVGENDEAFASLPSTTVETVKMLCELQGVVLVLSTDYGRGGVSDARNYKRSQANIYKAMVDREVGRKYDSAAGQWEKPPLPGLKTSLGNTLDDGTLGAILTTSSGDGGYPQGQITDPSENFGNFQVDE